jgi:hypothetical protein
MNGWRTALFAFLRLFLWPCVHYLVCHNLFAFTNCQAPSSTQRSNRW